MEEGPEGIEADFNHFYFHDNLNFFQLNSKGGMSFVIEHLEHNT